MPDLNAEVRLLAVLRRVPRGRVVTYGLLADLAGRPGRARWVARVLQRVDDPELPARASARGRRTLPRRTRRPVHCAVASVAGGSAVRVRARRVGQFCAKIGAV